MSAAVAAVALSAAQKELARRAAEIDIICFAVNTDLELSPAFDAALSIDASRVASMTAAASAALLSGMASSDADLFVAPDQRVALVAELSGPNERPIDVQRRAKILANYWNDLTRGASDALAIDGFNQQLSQSYEEVNLVYRMAKLLTGSSEPVRSVQAMCDDLRATLGYGWLTMIFTTGDGVIESLRGRLLRSGELPFDDATLVDMMSTFDPERSGKVLTAAAHPLAARAGYELLAVPVLHEDAAIGLLIAGDRRADISDVNSNEIQLVTAAASYLGLFHENAHRFAAQRQQFFGTLHALSSAVDAKDPYTAGHSQRVGLLGSQLAAAIGLPADEVDAIRVAGLLHDIGKIGVPEAVLRKPAKLDDDEFAMIKKHPEIGHQILKDLPSLTFHLPGVLYHHERWDGRGYPHQLAGTNIPLIARILALADTFDAMSSNRAYRKGMERGRVFEEMRKSAGVQFDPALVEPFLALDFAPFDLLNK